MELRRIAHRIDDAGIEVSRLVGQGSCGADKPIERACPAALDADRTVLDEHVPFSEELRCPGMNSCLIAPSPVSCLYATATPAVPPTAVGTRGS